jgi:hypothetical protein
MITNLHSLTLADSSHPKELTVPTKVYKMHRHELVLLNNANVLAMSLNNSKIDVETFKQKALQNFRKALPTFSIQFVKSFSHLIKPADLCLPLIQFVRDLFQRKIKLLRLNYPENLNIEKKWESFQLSLARFRYEPQDNFALDAKSFFTFLDEEMEKVNEPIEEHFSELQWSTLTSIYPNMDILEVEIGHFLNKVQPFLNKDQPGKKTEFVLIPLPHLTHQYNQLVDQLIELLQNYPKLMENYLQPILDKPHHDILNFSKRDLEKAKKNTKDALIALSHMKLNDLSNLNEIPDRIAFIKKAFWFNGELEVFANPLMNIKILNILKEYIQKTFSDTDPAKIYSSKDFEGKNIGANTFHLAEGYDIGSWTLKELEEHINNLEILLKCHQWTDLVIKLRVSKLYRCHQAICKWVDDRKAKNRFEICLHAINNQNYKLLSLKFVPKENQENLDSLVDFICGPAAPKKTSKKAKRAAQQNISSEQKVQNSDATKKQAEKSIKPEPENSQLALPLAEKQVKQLPIKILLDQLCALSHVNRHLDPTSPKKIALRHSILYLNSLFASFTAMQNGMKSKMPTKPLPHVVAVTQNAHYFLEQFLSYIAYEKGVDFIHIENCSHNLKRFWKQIDNVQVDSRVINLFYLTNIWNSYPFEQKDKWDEIENVRRRPEGLDLIHKVMKIQQDPEIIHKLTDYFHATITFAQDLITHELPELKDSQEKIPTTRDIAPLKQTFKLSLSKINKAVADCYKILTDWESRSNHIVISKLKQAHLGLLHLQEHLKELNQQTVVSDQIAPHVRNSLYWMHLSLEGVMQTIYALQSGVICKEHSLTTLFELIQWTNAVKPEEKEELVKWQNLHNLSRYPFNVQEVSSKAHELILKGEMLSDHPEYNEGFKLQALTPLEMIKISDENLTLANITKELEILLNSGLEILEKRLLPQLKVNLV